ncbi:MAG: hypothetical protein IH594_16100 [Bacteroidales bacterium]|nr:hypothetical protein [Bacteroidales bacterium]
MKIRQPLRGWSFGNAGALLPRVGPWLRYGYRSAVEDNNMINGMTPVIQTPVKMSSPLYDPVPGSDDY